MNRTWDEIVAERKGITLEEQIAERDAQEKEWTREVLIDDIKNVTFKTIDTLVLPALTAIIVAAVIIKMIKREMLKDGKFQLIKQKREISDNVPPLKEENTIVEILKPKQQPMRWFDFLVKFLMPFWLITSPLTLFGNLHLNIKEYYGSWKYYLTNPVDGIPNTLSLTLSLLMLIFLFAAWREVKKLTTKGYKYIVAFFVLVIILPTITTLIYLPFYFKAGINVDIYNTIGRTIPLLIVGIPSLIYFNKRKEVFSKHDLRRDSLGE